jgi:hypothetical protein
MILAVIELHADRFHGSHRIIMLISSYIKVIQQLILLSIENRTHNFLHNSQTDANSIRNLTG